MTQTNHNTQALPETVARRFYWAFTFPGEEDGPDPDEAYEERRAQRVEQEYGP